jgi:MFS family permease
MASTAVSTATAAKHPWALVGLLFTALSISFVDRNNLSVAAPILSSQLGLSPWEMGLLLSSFFWSYTAALPFFGWLVDRVDVRWVYAGGFLLWSLATMGTAAVSTFVGFLIMRLLIGFGESVTYPANSRILVTAFPENRRGLANGLTNLGSRFGPMVGTFLGALLVAKASWKGLFLITGGVGLLWLVPWMLWGPKNRPTHNPVQAASATPANTITWGQLFRRREVWGTCGGLFGANLTWYFFLTWLPSYLVQDRGMSMSSVAVWGSLPYLFMSVSLLGGGILADRLISQGRSPVQVRKTFLVSGLLAAAALMPTVLLPRIELSLAGLLLACIAFGAYNSNLWPMTQTLAGRAAAGRWTGLQNACGNISGILSPALAGLLIGQTGTFRLAFLAASVACLAGAASFGLLIRTTQGAEQQDTIRRPDDAPGETVRSAPM